MQTHDVIVDADMVSDDLQTRQTSHSRKRRRSKTSTLEEKKKKLIDLAHQALTNTDDDECAVAGKRIGYQLKGMAEQQTFIAEKLISGIPNVLWKSGKIKRRCKCALWRFYTKFTLDLQFIPPSKLSDTNGPPIISNIQYVCTTTSIANGPTSLSHHICQQNARNHSNQLPPIRKLLPPLTVIKFT
jgi:hypothetical protein